MVCKLVNAVAAAARLHLLQKKIEALTGSWTRVEENSAVGGSGRPSRTMATEAVEDEPLGDLRRVSASLEGQCVSERAAQAWEKRLQER